MNFFVFKIFFNFSESVLLLPETIEKFQTRKKCI